MTKILIVDDAIFMRKTLKVLLEKNDCTVIGEASDGEEALRQINALKPDVVTLDITMPTLPTFFLPTVPFRKPGEAQVGA